MWNGNMSEENRARYEEVFERAEPYVHQVCTFIWQIYPFLMRSLKLCAALIYWNIVPMLKATYFLTRWLLPFDVLNWRTLRAVVSVCGAPLLKDEFRGANGQLVNEDTVPIPPVLNFHWSFAIRIELEGGAYQEQYYQARRTQRPYELPHAF